MDKFKIYHQKKSFTETQNKKPEKLLLGAYYIYTLFEYKSQKLFFTSNTSRILVISSLWWGQKTIHKRFKQFNCFSQLVCGSFYLSPPTLHFKWPEPMLELINFMSLWHYCLCQETIKILTTVIKKSYSLIHKGKYLKS